MNPLATYTRWLHTRWPAGTLEKLPDVREDGSTNMAGVYVVGDLTGIPLLKFSSDSGTRAIHAILADPSFLKRDQGDKSVLDIVIIGAGVSGIAAAAEATKRGLSVSIIEVAEPLSTIVNFPARKPIYTYPTDMTPAGDLQFGDKSAVKEGLVDELRDFMDEHKIEPIHGYVERIARKGATVDVIVQDGAPQRAHRVIVAIGRSGNYRTLSVPGEDLDKTYNRLHDPKDFCDRRTLVVGGGDSALETAIALATCGSEVTLSYRKPEFSRAKPDNIEEVHELARAGSVRLLMSSSVTEIRETEVEIMNADGTNETLANDVVFLMIGREPPLDFFRRSDIRVRGDRGAKWWVSLLVFFVFCAFLYHWKSDAGFGLKTIFKNEHFFPFNIIDPENSANLFGTVLLSMQKPSFWYTLAYTTCIIIFGIKRIRRRRTPYVTTQTLALMSIQTIPLFILPFLLLPWLGHNGWFDDGFGKTIADALFPLSQWDNHGREYWRSVGFILAWPLLPWNFFTHTPMMAWLIIGSIQTFVIIPFIVWKWGKGAYCGWICSCGALAETMGDTHRHKMPHGPFWNRLNMIGQVFLWLVAVLFIFRIAGWVAPDGSGFKHFVDAVYNFGFAGKSASGSTLGFPLSLMNYAWFVDLLWAGVFGVTFYFWFSGRVWCRFACPLAALMHIYARFSRFRIIAEKSKCISCNVCTSVCHQGIDIMNFANKGLPMEDPECVRCSACVQSCPTGVLTFGEINPKTGAVLRTDRLHASPVQMSELTVGSHRI